MRQRKVGTLTLGSLLVFYGILFLLQAFVGKISYYFIFRLWPIIFIALGIEIIFSSVRWKEHEFKYDFPAIIIICILIVFAMGMAGLDWLYTNDYYHCYSSFYGLY